mmetsp:Transcript_63592/g.113164  ORF Transcript_63592/g.113164 Transcript_63592/m.113164 type:complete len:517 (-) Transcript_63592:124-1674(-)
MQRFRLGRLLLVQHRSLNGSCCLRGFTATASQPQVNSTSVGLAARRGSRREKKRLAAALLQDAALQSQPFGERLRQLGHRYAKAIGFGGYVLLTLQWCMDDVLLLRSFGVACATSMAIFLYCQPVPLMVPVRFNLLFIAINGFYIFRILAERRDLKLDDVEQMLWDLGFGAFLTKVELRALLDQGRRYEAEPGLVVAQSGMPVQQKVLAIAKGGLSQTRAGQIVANFEPGDFWGEFQLLERARHTGAVHKVTTTFSASSVVVEWDTSALSEYLANKPVVRQKLQELWAEGLNVKLDRRNADANERAYVDILRGILCNGTVGETEAAFLKHVRQVHNISDNCHVHALNELGYSEQEFVAIVDKGRQPWFLRWLNMGGGRIAFSRSTGFKPEPKHNNVIQPAAFLIQQKQKTWLDLDVHVSGRSETGWSDSPCRRSDHSPWASSPSSGEFARQESARGEREAKVPRTRSSSLPAHPAFKEGRARSTSLSALSGREPEAPIEPFSPTRRSRALTEAWAF